jgi:AraC-like DNA-binding protein
MLQYQNENFGRSYDYRRREHDVFVIPAHIHEYSELLYVREGEMTMQIGGERHTVPAGHIAVILPNEIHAYTDETPCRVWCAVFSNDFITLFLRRLGDRVPRTPIVDLSDRQPLLRALEQADPTDALRLSGLLQILYSELAARMELSERPRSSGQVCKAAIEYVSSHFRSDITLSSVATHLGYHEKYLSTALHTLTGMNFCMFLASYRVDHAKRLLREETDKSVSRVALESGFSSINTFNRVFRRLTGMTPCAYRAQGEEVKKEKA